MTTCPICESPAPKQMTDGRWVGFDCPRCGRWGIAAATDSMALSMLAAKLGSWDSVSVRRRSRLSYIVRQQQPADGRWWGVPHDTLESLHLDQPLPTPSEQLERLVLLLGENQPSPAESAHVQLPLISAAIGTLITPKNAEANLGWLLTQEESVRLIDSREAVAGGLFLRLKMTGWDRYSELLRGRVESKRVLMAMQFDDVELDRVVDACFTPAVRRAGFELSPLNRNQPAGIIDDQMRVAIRTSRFILADLTHANRGAYWEAGFAEGLGRPVIYTCREDVWKKERSHFDTNHLTTIVWTTEELSRAGERLTETIRATLPAEAVMTDS